MFVAIVDNSILLRGTLTGTSAQNLKKKKEPFLAHAVPRVQF